MSGGGATHRFGMLGAAMISVVAASAPGCSDQVASRRDSSTVDVFAAASLTDAFGEIADAFEAEHPGHEVELVFAGTSALREQILAGAPADVFAAADESIMDALVERAAVAAPTVFATNRLALAVPAGNPGGVSGLDDLAVDDLLVGLCAPQVPCGRLALAVLEAAGVEASPDTAEPDVRALLTKISARELDAGLVYETDVLAAGSSVEGIPIAQDAPADVRYPIAVVADSSARAAAEDFVAFVTGPDGRRILDRFGFGAP